MEKLCVACTSLEILRVLSIANLISYFKHLRPLFRVCLPFLSRVLFGLGSRNCQVGSCRVLTTNIRVR